MATKKKPDELTVTIICDVTVSEKGWRELMLRNGKDMSGVVIPAQIQLAGVTIIQKNFEQMGFPQPSLVARIARITATLRGRSNS